MENMPPKDTRHEEKFFGAVLVRVSYAAGFLITLGILGYQFLLWLRTGQWISLPLASVPDDSLKRTL